MTFSNPVVGGTTLIRPAIHSPDYVQGNAGWSINKDGTAEFNNVVVRGSGVSNAVIVGPANGPQVQIGSSATAGFIKLPTNRPIEHDVSTLLSGVLNQGLPNEAATLQILGPTVNGATNRSQLFLNSQNNDGSSNANASLRTGTGTLVMDQDVATLSGPRLNVAPQASASDASLVSANGTHTGNLFRVVKGVTEQLKIDATGVCTHVSDVNVGGNLSATGSVTSGGLVVNGNANVTGNLTAGNIQRGTTAITTVANQWVEVAVTFPAAFSSTPVVTATGNNNAPAVGGTTTLYDAVTAVTTTGFTLRVFRGTAITMNYGWIAIA
jgi:hypothetical protein